MAKRGRKLGIPNGQALKKDACFFCEGTGLHWGSECKGCDGSGSDKVRKQLLKVYNAKNGLPINQSIIITGNGKCKDEKIIYVFDSSLNITEQYKGTLTSFSKKTGLGLGNLKGRMSRNTERFKRYINGVSAMKFPNYLYKKDYDTIKYEISNYQKRKKAQENAIKKFGEL